MCGIAENKMNENEDGVTAANPDGLFAELTDSVSAKKLGMLMSCCMFIELVLSCGSCESKTSCWPRAL